VSVETAGTGIRRVRVANLTPEVTEEKIMAALSQYGEVKRIIVEMWPQVYRYPASNGIILVDIGLHKHIPSHMNIVGNRVLISIRSQRRASF